VVVRADSGFLGVVAQRAERSVDRQEGPRPPVRESIWTRAMPIGASLNPSLNLIRRCPRLVIDSMGDPSASRSPAQYADRTVPAV
jgi:hypothetical protein